LVSLSNQYLVVTNNNNENDNIRELLFVHKNFLYKMNNNSVNNNNSNLNNNNKINKNKNEYSFEIYYITIKNAFMDHIKEYCIPALDENENFIFNGISLKSIYEKIFKFGIAICKKKYVM